MMERLEPQQCLRPQALSSDPHPVVVGGVWVLVAGDDLGGHPVRRPDEGVPSPHRPVQLGADAKVHCRAHGSVLVAICKRDLNTGGEREATYPV